MTANNAVEGSNEKEKVYIVTDNVPAMQQTASTGTDMTVVEVEKGFPKSVDGTIIGIINPIDNPKSDMVDIADGICNSRQCALLDPHKRPNRKLPCLPKTRTLEIYAIVTMACLTSSFMPGLIYDWQHFSILLVRSGAFASVGATENEQADHISSLYSVHMMAEHITGVLASFMLARLGNYKLTAIGVALHISAICLMLLGVIKEYSWTYYWYCAIVTMGMSSAMINFAGMDVLFRIDAFHRTTIAALICATSCSLSFVLTPLVALQGKFDWDVNAVITCWLLIVDVPILLVNILLIDKRPENDGAGSIITLGAGTDGSVWDCVSSLLLNTRPVDYSATITHEECIPAPGRQHTLSDSESFSAPTVLAIDEPTDQMRTNDDWRRYDEIGCWQAVFMGLIVAIFLGPIGALYTSKVLPYIGESFASAAGVGFSIYNVTACIPQAILVDMWFPWTLFTIILFIASFQVAGMYSLTDTGNTIVNWIGAMGMWTGPLITTIRFRYTQRVAPKYCGAMLGIFYLLSGMNILIMVVLTRVYKEYERHIFIICVWMLFSVAIIIIVNTILELVKNRTVEKFIGTLRQKQAIHTDFD